MFLGRHPILDIIYEAQLRLGVLVPEFHVDDIKTAMILNYKATHNVFNKDEKTNDEIYMLSRRLINLYHQKSAHGL